MIDYIVQRRSPLSGAWMSSFVTDNDEKAAILAQSEVKHKNTAVRVLRRETTLAWSSEKGTAIR